MGVIFDLRSRVEFGFMKVTLFLIIKIFNVIRNALC